MKPRENMNVKYNVNEYTRREYLTLNDVETPMMKNFKHAMYSKHKYGMKVELSDYKCIC
jgi:hypothetical protein